jgi:two-component system sensor histidine kinase DctS
VRVKACGENGDVLLSVSDTGVGIPEEAARMIFTPLYTTKAKGVGLGLSFCKRVVEAHGGSIGFASKQGEGTTFNVRLPNVKPTQA